MAMRQLTILGGLCWALALPTNGQCALEDPRSSKASKWLERAQSPKPKDSLEDRMAAVQEALELHPDDTEAWMMLANFNSRPPRGSLLGVCLNRCARGRVVSGGHA